MDLKPPTVFGSMGIFGQRLEGEFAETAEKSLICRVSRPALERVLRRQPDVALRLLDLLGRRLGEVERRVEEMAALTAEQRLAAFLLRLTETSGGILTGFTQDGLAEVERYRPSDRGAHPGTVAPKRDCDRSAAVGAYSPPRHLDWDGAILNQYLV